MKYNKQIGTEKKSGMFRFALLGYRGLKIKKHKKQYPETANNMGK